MQLVSLARLVLKRHHTVPDFFSIDIASYADNIFQSVPTHKAGRLPWARKGYLRRISTKDMHEG
jgi:hypothetical protein